MPLVGLLLASGLAGFDCFPVDLASHAPVSTDLSSCGSGFRLGQDDPFPAEPDIRTQRLKA